VALAGDTPSPWAAAEVGKAIGLGLINETLQSDYQANITREDFCAMIMTLVHTQDEEIVKGLELPDNPFEDTGADEIIAAYALGIVNGKSESVFDPNGAIQRQEAAAMLSRAASVFELDTSAKISYFADADRISQYAKESVDFVYTTGIMKGTGNAMFNPTGFYTREQAYMTALRLYNVLNGIKNEQTAATALEVKRIDSAAYGKPLRFLNGLLYFISNDGNVCRAPVGAPEKADVLFSLETEDYTYAQCGVYNDMLFLTIHYGGVVMGRDETIVILPDGRIETFGYDVKAYASANDYTIAFGDGIGALGPVSYLEARAEGEKEFRTIGEEGYTYGLYMELDKTAGTITARAGSGFAVLDDEVYTIAQYYGNEEFSSPGIYKVHAGTGKTERVIERAAISFELSDGYIFFLGEDNLLYKTRIGQDLPERVSAEKMSRFFFLGNEIFFTPYEKWGQLHKISGDKTIPVTDLNNAVGNISEEYYAATSYMQETDRHSGFVIDRAGNVYKCDPQLNVEYITVLCGIIWIVV